MTGRRRRESFIETDDALYEFLKHSEEASSIWGDSEDIIALANMYEIRFKVIQSEESSKRIEYVIPPDKDFKCEKMHDAKGQNEIFLLN